MIFYQAVSVTAKGTTWKDSEKKEFDFMAEKITVHFVSGTGPVEISFNGHDLHGELGGGKLTTLELHDMMASGIWVRGAGDEVLQVWAWAK